MRIILAESAGSLESVRGLFRQYWDSFGFTPCFQGFADKVARPPGDYGPPGGRLALLLVDSAAAGCVALRRVDAERCEGKRLYVRPEFRGRGFGLALLGRTTPDLRGIGIKSS